MKGNILLVDDQKFNRLVMEKIITKEEKGYTFYEAENGDEAVAILKSVEIDLIILDLMMPVVDGFTVLEKLRKDPLIGDMPVMVYTALSDIYSIERTLKMGAVDYFFKPLSQIEMQITIPLKVKNAIEKHRACKQRQQNLVVMHRFWNKYFEYEDSMKPFEIKHSDTTQELFFDVVYKNNQWVFLFCEMNRACGLEFFKPFLKCGFQKGIDENLALEALYKEVRAYVGIFSFDLPYEVAVMCVSKEGMQCLGTKGIQLYRHSLEYGWEPVPNEGRLTTIRATEQIVFLSSHSLRRHFPIQDTKVLKDRCWLHFVSELHSKSEVSVHEIQESFNNYTTYDKKYPIEIIIINGFGRYLIV